jgi:3-deoxy-7-phosphoheptulonate synthase / chorismate mutase
MSREAADLESGLQALRKRIDSIDIQLLGLLNARAAVVADVYALKRANGITRFDPARTQAILDTLAAATAGPLSADDVRALFEPILQFFVESYAPR